MYTWLISFRYLRSRKILFFPIGGVAVGVMIMILVSSVFNGFSRDMRDRIRGTLSHLVVRRWGGYIGEWRSLLAELEKIPGVAAAAPRYEWMAAVSHDGGRVIDRGKAYTFVGIDPEREAKISELPYYVLSQSGEEPRAASDGFSPRERKARPISFKTREGKDPEHSGAIVGCELFYGLDHNEEFREYGTTVNLISARLDEAAESVKSFQGSYTIVGRFRSGMSEYDSQMMYLPLEEAQRFMQPAPAGKYYDLVTDVHIKLVDYAQDDHYRDVIQEFLDRDGRWGSLHVSTWEDEKRILLQAVEIEKKINSVIMFFIVIVAGFNVIAILNFMVEAKTRDIGILKALGATRAGISKVFLVNGILIGMIGAGTGILAGLGIAHNLNAIEKWVYRMSGWRLFPPNVYYLDHVPSEVNYPAVFTIVVSALIVSLIFSMYPAWRAARLDPIETIRYEA